MPSGKQCDLARRVTGSKESDININMQCDAISSSDKFLLSNSIDRLIKKFSVSIETGWDVLKEDLERIALEYLVGPAASYCIYKEWKHKQNGR